MNGVQATPLDAPVHETGDVQGSRDDAYAVANDLSCDEESVHNQGLLNWHIFGSGADRVGHLRPMRVHTDWLVCCQVASGASAWLFRGPNSGRTYVVSPRTAMRQEAGGSH